MPKQNGLKLMQKFYDSQIIMAQASFIFIASNFQTTITGKNDMLESTKIMYLFYFILYVFCLMRISRKWIVQNALVFSNK